MVNKKSGHAQIHFLYIVYQFLKFKSNKLRGKYEESKENQRLCYE